MDSAHFLADVHLAPDMPGISRLFAAYLRQAPTQTRHLYILGDLFALWVGDDSLREGGCHGAAHNLSYEQAIAEQLAAASAQGLSIAIQHGNRDFLLGEEFMRAAGCSLLPDPFILNADGEQFVLSHGDALCVNDAAYMAFRGNVRRREWQEAVLARPLTERRLLARQLRAQSEAQQNGQYQDLDAAATDDFLRQHGYVTFIHGHTHQPACHAHLVDGIAVDRWVLADWQEHGRTANESRATFGEILRLNQGKLSRQVVVLDNYNNATANDNDNDGDDKANSPLQTSLPNQMQRPV